MDYNWNQRLQELQESLEQQEQLSQLRSIRWRIRKVRKSLDTSQLEQQWRNHTPKTGKGYKQRHWVNPNKGKGRTQEVQINAESIPTVKLEPLPEELRVENCDRTPFLKALKEFYFEAKKGPSAYKWVTWKDGKTQFLIKPAIFKHANSNTYCSNERTNLARAALYQIDKLLFHAAYDRELEPKSEPGITNVYRYLVKASTRKYGPEAFQIIVKRRTDVSLAKGAKRLPPTDVVYDVLDIEGVDAE